MYTFRYSLYYVRFFSNITLVYSDSVRVAA